jgi:hypothetical protein
MVRQSCLIAILLAAALHLGCDQPKPATPAPGPTTMPTTAPSTQPVAEVPTSQPATQPAFSQLMIDGQMYNFPSAKLHVGKSGSHVVARLFTDDPKAALEDDYKGNHYDVQMRLDDIQAPEDVYMAAWQYKSQSAEYNNTPYGIFLDGMRYQLQPLDVSARFLGTMFQVHIDLEGQFLVFDDSDKTAAPKVVYVKGSLLAPVDYKD